MPWDSRITLRGDKGSPLTHEELDINFKNFFHSASREGSVLSLFRSTSLDNELQIPFEAPVGRNYSIQIKSGNAVSGAGVSFTGSHDLRYNWDDKILVVTGSEVLTEDLYVGGNVYVTGSVRASQFITDIVSSSVTYTSGSNKFGDTQDDQHDFTGSLFVTKDTFLGNALDDSTTITGSVQILNTGQVTKIQDSILSHTGSFRNLGSIQQTGGLTRDGSFTSRGHNLVYQVSQSGTLGTIITYATNNLLYGNRNYYGTAFTYAGLGGSVPIMTIAGDIQVTRNGKIRNSYTAVGDLPNAATYRGNFGYLESSGSFIAANGTKYVEIAETSVVNNNSASNAAALNSFSQSNALVITNLSSSTALDITSLSSSIAADLTIVSGSGSGGAGVGFPFAGNDDGAPADITGSLRVSGSNTDFVDFTMVGSVSASIFSGSYVGDGSGLTGITVDSVATVSDTFTGVTSYTATHNFDTKDVIVSVYVGDEIIHPDTISTPTNNTVTITFAAARTGRVVVAKGGHVVSGSTDWTDLSNIPADIVSSSTQAAGLGFAVTSSSNQFKASQYVTGSIEATVDIIAYATSDERLKENIEQITSSLQIVSSLTGYSYTWKEEAPNTGDDYGVIAQDVEKVLPLAVSDREDGYKGVRYEKLIPVLINSINELKAEVEELKSRL